MRRSAIFIALGIVQIIILTLVGLYFYRLKQNPSARSVPTIPQLELEKQLSH